MMRRGLRAVHVLVLLILCSGNEPGISNSKPDLVGPAKARFVLVTSDCLLGSGFLTGYQEDGKAEIITAYHLIRCGNSGAKRQSKKVYADGLTAEIRGMDPQHDLLRLLVPRPVTVSKISIRTEPNYGEPVFTIGSNPHGDRGVVTWGNVLIAPPGEVTAKAAIPRGTSGGQMMSAVDGALLGVPVREDLGFADAVSSKVLVQFLEKARK